MIRDDVIFWVSAALLVFFAFVVMPANEYFKDSQGREVDVDPNAPPKPDWLKPISERTGKKETFWSMLGWGKEDFTDTHGADVMFDTRDANGKALDVKANAPAAPQWLTPTSSRSIGATAAPLSGVTLLPSGTLPQFNTESTLGSTTGTTGMEPTATRGDLQAGQVRFIQTLIGNEPDQATKRALSSGLANLQEVVRGSPTSVSNVPIGSTDKAVLAGLTNIPATYTYRQFAYAFQSAGGTNASPENIINMVQSIPIGFNAATAPRPAISTISQMSQMSEVMSPDLYGPGPNVLRSALQSCSCGSQTSSCPMHA